VDFVYDVPASRVVFGIGRIRQVPDEVDRLGGERVLLIAGGRQNKHADELAAALGPRVVDRIGEVVVHVPATLAVAASERTEQSGADLLVCLGGGSSIGLAKAVALRTRLSILAIPTTYAGSEMTPIWGLTDGGRKTTGRDRTVLPATVVYDPALTMSLPTDISAASGMNAPTVPWLCRIRFDSRSHGANGSTIVVATASSVGTRFVAPWNRAPLFACC